MGEIYLVRHGQASFAAADYDELSPLGHDQSRRLGRWHAELGLVADGIALGGLKRHRQTAEAWAAEQPAAPAPERWTVDRGFDEYDHREVLLRAHPEAGDLAGLQRWLAAEAATRGRYQEIFQAAMARWMSGLYDADYWETWPQFQGRCLGALEALVASAGASQRLVVFTSGGTISAIVRTLLDLPPARVVSLNWSLANSGVTKLFYSGQRLGLGYLNNYSHLERDRDPALVTYR